MEILRSTNYEEFTRITGNRLISKRKVDRIVRDVESGLDLFKYCPIVVDPKKAIIDGQHRFTAAKQLNLPIYYVVAEGIKLRDIARMNSNTDKWKASDFIDCYIQLGLKEYQVLKDFMSQYHTSVRISVCLLMTGKATSSSEMYSKFKDGELSVDFLKKAERIMDLTERLFGMYRFSRDRNLIQAVERLDARGIWDVDIMEEKIKSHKNMMDKQTSVKTYMYLIEQIYNMRNHRRQCII